MIQKIDILNFGSYQNFQWDTNVKDANNIVKTFKKLNIIYGRNYSGKTTLSNIFRYMETGRIHEGFDAPNFLFHTDSGVITQNNITSRDLNIRVYNRNFVEDNLNFLVNQEGGEIRTFAIVGEINQEIEKKIVDIESKLGSIDKKTGIKFDLEIKRKEFENKNELSKVTDSELEEKLRSYANNTVKKNREYGDSNYFTENIKKDINLIKQSNFQKLTDEEKKLKVELLKQNSIENIPNIEKINLKFNSIASIANEILTKSLKPTEAIQELLNEELLQIWVKQGIPLHKEKRHSCGFCRQKLPEDIWQVLDSHFDEESSKLENKIDECIASIKYEIEATGYYLSINRDLYAEEKVTFESIKKSLEIATTQYKHDLEILKDFLIKKKNNPFKEISIPSFKKSDEEIKSLIEEMNSVIKKSNSRTLTLEKEKEIAREKLRLTDISNFIETINYDVEKLKIEELKKNADLAKKNYEGLDKLNKDLEEQIIFHRSQQKDEQKGAERINSLLTNFFGHDSLKLEAKTNVGETGVKFEITRNKDPAYNLSDGERSLIAFCYFMAKLEELENNGKDLIIYIDDPISSLDSNHIFFIYSLIDSLIAQPIKGTKPQNYKYKQLFISTHNLEFLKYLKRLHRPDKDFENFLIERDSNSSKISMMPGYLKKYVTEFNYLFEQIYKCKEQPSVTSDHHPYYNFGNNLRKFLEIFLYFKLPNLSEDIDKYQKFFGEDEMAISFINRISNEYSHLGGAPERGFHPIDIAEITKVANFVLDKINQDDKRQYDHLLKSIGIIERTD